MDEREENESKAVDNDRSAIDDEEQRDADAGKREDSSVKVRVTSDISSDDSGDDDSAVGGEAEEPEGKEDTATEVEVESERFIRLAAEFDNYKKRTAREFEGIVRRANERLLRELVDIVDNFERALSAESGDDDSQAYRKGVELIYNQFCGLLSKEGISAIEATGKPFDPTYHEAVMQVASDEFDEGIVAQEIRKGYKIDGKVLRHARVIVSKGPAGDDGEQTSDENE